MVPITDRCSRPHTARSCPAIPDAGVIRDRPVPARAEHRCDRGGRFPPAPRRAPRACRSSPAASPPTTPVDADAPPPVPTPRPAAEEPFPGLVTTIGRLSHVPAADLWPTAGAMASWLASHPGRPERRGRHRRRHVRARRTAPCSWDPRPAAARSAWCARSVRSSDEGLGVLLRVAAVQDGGSVVWIAGDPGDAHCAALSWLNRATSPRFTLLRVTGVRIDGSASAPMFDVAVRPPRGSDTATEAGGPQRRVEDHLTPRADGRRRGRPSGRGSARLARMTSQPAPTRRATADFLNHTVRDIPPSGIRRFFDMLAEMKDVISLTIGEPDFTTPSGDHAGGDREPGGGGDPLHRQRRDDRAARADRPEPSRPLRRGLRPAHRGRDHGRGIRGRGRLPARHDQPRRRGHLPRAMLRGLRAVHPARRRRGGAGRHHRRHRLPRDGRHDPRRDRPADQGHLPGLPEQPHRRRARSGGARGHRPRRRRARPAGVLGRDLRPAGVRRPRAHRLQRAGRHARPHRAARRVQQVVRDDRLAHRLRCRPGRADGGHRQGPPVRDHVRADRRTVRRDRGAPHRRAARCRRCAPSTTGGAGT